MMHILQFPCENHAFSHHDVFGISLFFKVLLWPLGKAKLVDKISNSLIIDNSKIKTDTGWKPNISLIDELKCMIENSKN